MRFLFKTTPREKSEFRTVYKIDMLYLAWLICLELTEKILRSKCQNQAIIYTLVKLLKETKNVNDNSHLGSPNLALPEENMVQVIANKDATYTISEVFYASVFERGVSQILTKRPRIKRNNIYCNKLKSRMGQYLQRIVKPMKITM